MKQKIYIAALLAGMLVLAGCGGGSDAVISQNPSEKAVMEASALTTDTMALTTALDAANDADPITEALIDDVVAALAKLRATIAATTEADTEDAEEAFADGTEDLDDLREKQLATVQGELDKSQGKDAETLAKNLHAALVAVDRTSSGDTVNKGELDDQTYAFNGTKGTVTIVPTGTSADTDPVLAKTTDSVSANSGWTGGHFKGKGDNKDHEARVYWLAETKAKGTKFSALTLTTDPDGATKAGTSNVITAFDFTSAEATDRIVIAGFTGTSGEITPPGARTTGTGDDAVHTWSGSYYGVPGTYSCSGEADNCTASRHADEKRKLTGSGTWMFTVTPANADMEVADTSNTYSYYGWWINKATAGYQFDSLFGGTTVVVGADANTGVGGASGTATYNGGAAGKYAIYSTTPKAAESGDFTADVTLTADFDATIEGISNLTTISGTIDDFMVGGSKKEGWEVAIEKNAANGNTTTNMFTGDAVWTIGESEGAAGGDWQASFQDMDDKDGVPKIVVGGFDVANGSAEMEGAFGATK